MYEENKSGDMSAPWQTSTLHKIYIVSIYLLIINTTSLMRCS